MKEMWDERFGGQEYVYGKEPNRFFKEQLSLLSPGNLLMPAEGEGRNAVYAASRGWSVDAFDYSKSGYQKALSLAKEMDVKINYELSDFNTFHFKSSWYDAIGLVYFHVPGESRQIMHQKIIDSLAPGGKIILEAFHTSQLGNNTGGPQSLDFLFDEQKLKNDFKDLFIEKLEVYTATLDEGLYHQGEAHLIRFVGMKQER